MDGSPAIGKTDPVPPEKAAPTVTGEEVTRLKELVDDIPTTGLKGSVAGSKKRAKASDAYLKEKASVLNAAAQKHQMPVSILSAITSRESDGKGALKSLTYFKTTPAKQLQKIKDCIVAKLKGYNYHSIKQFKESKYYKYKLSDMKGLTANDKVWGDHGFGFGVTQFDVRWHAKKVLDMLALSKAEAEDALIMNASALLAEELDKATAAHSSWSEAECLQAAIAAYNAGSTIHDGKGDYPKMNKFNADLISARTTGKDYAHDVVARAQYYEENPNTDSGTTGDSTDNTGAEDTGNSTDSSNTTDALGTISDSVGKGGTNKSEDVKIVQTLLKGLAYNLGASGPNGDGVDGDCGKTTIKHITDFQKKNFSWTPDGLISTTGNTWKKLSGGTAAPDPVNDATNTGGSSDEQPIVAGNYFSHKNAESVTISYGSNAVKLNAQAAHLAKSIAAEAGLKSIRITSTIRTYADQARINYEQNSGTQIEKWYGHRVFATWSKYKQEKRSTAEYAKYLEARDKKRGRVLSKHLSGLCLDVAPHNAKFSNVCARLKPISGSGVKTYLVEKGCTHTEFTFKVT